MINCLLCSTRKVENLHRELDLDVISGWQADIDQVQFDSLEESHRTRRTREEKREKEAGKETEKSHFQHKSKNDLTAIASKV